MLAADSQLEVGFGAAALLTCGLNELPDAGLVERLERINVEQFTFEIVRQERVDVVTAKAERQLRQIIRSEAEEVSDLGDFVRGERGARNLDHRADWDVESVGISLGLADFIERLFGERSSQRTTGLARVGSSPTAKMINRANSIAFYSLCILQANSARCPCDSLRRP